MQSYRMQNGKLIRVVEEEVDQSAIMSEINQLVAQIKPYKDAVEKLKRENNQFNLDILQRKNEIQQKENEVAKRENQIAEYEKAVTQKIEMFSGKIDKEIVKIVAPDKASVLGF